MKYVCEKTGKVFDDELDAEISETAYACRVNGFVVAVDHWTVIPDGVTWHPSEPYKVELDLRGWSKERLRMLFNPHSPCDCVPWPLPFVFGGILGFLLAMSLTIWVLGV